MKTTRGTCAVCKSVAEGQSHRVYFANFAREGDRRQTGPETYDFPNRENLYSETSSVPGGSITTYSFIRAKTDVHICNPCIEKEREEHAKDHRGFSFGALLAGLILTAAAYGFLRLFMMSSPHTGMPLLWLILLALTGLPGMFFLGGAVLTPLIERSNLASLPREMAGALAAKRAPNYEKLVLENRCGPFTARRLRRMDVPQVS